MNKKYDAIVVGGGPAGGTAAYFLGQAGRRMLVLEKETLPRYKACGGGISAHILEQFPFSFEAVIESKVKAISYALGAETTTVPLPDQSVRMVMRNEFDAYLLKHAQAEIRQGVSVRAVEEKEDAVIVETAEGERIEGNYLIAADGANSVIAHSVGLRRKKVIAAAIEVEAVVPTEVFARYADQPLFIFGEVATGYLWIFPKSDHLSIGIGALHPKPGELQTTLERVMARYGISIKGQPQKGHPIPIYNRREPISTHRTLLVGDAAGLVDPFTGEGIRFAIKSGRLAAEAILSGHPECYAAQIDRQIGRNHRLGIILTSLFYSLPQASFELVVRNPFVTHALVEMLADRIDYGGVMLQMFGTLPLFILTETIASLGDLIGGSKITDSFRRAVYSI
jgi:geranylgeranyl reductase family protein